MNRDNDKEDIRRTNSKIKSISLAMKCGWRSNSTLRKPDGFLSRGLRPTTAVARTPVPAGEPADPGPPPSVCRSHCQRED